MKALRLLVVLALLGIVVAAVVVLDTTREPTVQAASEVAPAVTPPFAHYLAGTGITETGRGNVAIGTAVSGIVREVDVRVGDRVRAGDPLFGIDDRDARAQLAVARAAAEEAEAALAKPRHRLDYLLALRRLDRSTISAQAVSDAQDDLRAAEATRDAARARVDQLGVDIDRLLVRAPRAGTVLQVNARAGEFAVGGDNGKPLMLLGDDTRMYLRVDIDENDAWRVRPGAEARAYLRGNPHIAVPLHYEYTEPYVTPKTSLTGQGSERTDVRVLQVIYSFERGDLPVYLGQQMDAFIRTGPDDRGHG
jgi:multidrug resistance efflux pump